ncbi:MAG: ATP-binding protein [Firmicutes bacterium]|nr:ATP-binding protein [Bacillota bacterium]
MIFYEIKLDDLFQFKNFSVDFTYTRESKYSPIIQAHKNYPNLKFKKFAILLGANASGKTTLGMALCFIQNFLNGKDVSKISFANINNFFEKGISNTIDIDTTFSTLSYMYRVHVQIGAKGIVSETWWRVKLKDLSYIKHKSELESSKPIYKKEKFEGVSFVSYFLTTKENISHRSEIQRSLGFIYSFSGADDNLVDENIELRTDIIKKIAMAFDSSISDVTDSKEVPGNKIIHFKNGHKEIILKNGKLGDIHSSVLSTGTKEGIMIAFMMNALYKNSYNTLYIDEKLSHSHSEIEQQIIQILITLIDRIDGQVFITSHNSDLLDMDIPNYNFILFKKNRDGSITDVIEPEKVVKHHNRKLKKIVEEDVFSTAPILDSLIDLHDSIDR